MAVSMQGLGAWQASIDYHLEVARRCLALSASQRSLSGDDMLPKLYEEKAVEQTRQGSRIAAKIVHLRNLTATLTPVPATTEVDPYRHSMFDRFRASVGALWGDRREHGPHDQMDSRFPSLVQVHADSPNSRRSTSRHRRAGSSKI